MRRLAWGGAVAGVLCLVAALLAVVYVEAGCSAEERLCRQRGCYLCHAPAFSEPLGCLGTWRRGEPLVPLISRRLLEEHAWLAGEAAPVLAAYIARQQLPAVAAMQAGSRAESLYLAKCAACHGRGGEGVPGQFPPLMGSEWLTEVPSRLPDVLRNGLQGPIRVRGVEWNAVMLPPGVHEADYELLISFLRGRFGGSGH